ncbi:MAG: glycosyltransferase involved in cell wall biosynthesis [Bacteroidia bacterium]|jgi:glycosyltransferase involved in cell wall biosynthesis
MKRVALIGNMNNNFFAITRLLRDKGYDAHLYYRSLSEHFQPKSDTFSLNFYDYCHPIDWLDKSFELADFGRIKKEVAGFDFYIGQGDEAAFAKRAGINFNLYYPYGSDFYKYAYLPSKNSWKERVYMALVKGIPLSKSRNGTVHKYIRKVIVDAENVFLDLTNPEYDQKLFDLNLKGEFEALPMPFIYPDEYLNRTDWDTHWKSSIDALRHENEFIVLYHGRQEWKKALEYSGNSFTNKNTHHLIIGFSKFVEKYPNIKAQLLMLDYGGDVANSKNLIEELNISNRVTWFPKMYRKDLMYLINNVDLCSGEFGKSYLTFGTIIEAMLMGKPIVHHRIDEYYSKKYSELYPMYNARSPEEIGNAIINAYEDPDARLQTGKKAQEWVLKYFIDNPLNELRKLIDKTND